jgi:hypothetical protein
VTVARLSGRVAGWGVRHIRRADAFLLVAGPGLAVRAATRPETCWSAPRGRFTASQSSPSGCAVHNQAGAI